MRCFLRYALLWPLLVACHSGGSTAPSSLAVAGWSPYVGVHPFGAFQGVQQSYLQPLLANGSVHGLRLDMNSPDSEFFADWALNNGVDDIVAVFPNEYLRDGRGWDELSRQMARNPRIRHWEIGNEVNLFIAMPPEEYMPIFLDLHARAEQEFPDNIVIPQAVPGITDGPTAGDRDFRRMMDLGLERLANERRLPVVTVHAYSMNSDYLPSLSREIRRLPATTEVWVTEAGTQRQDRHLDFVTTDYANIRRTLRATRIYWYVFAECPGARNSDYSLVIGLPGQCEDGPHFSPLYNALLGGAS